MSAWIVVVGAGPAGLMAASEAVERGARVTLVDEFPRPGGQIYRQSASAKREVPIGLESERNRKRAILSAFERIAGRVEYLKGAVAYSLFPGPELHVAHEGATRELRPDAVVLATGVCERAVPFPGWTLPGVLFAGGVQATLKSQGIRAGERAVVVGAGVLPIAVAAQLVESGADVQSLVLTTPLRAMLRRPLGLWAGRTVVAEGRRYLRTLRSAGVERLEGWVPVRAEGSERVERLTVARHRNGHAVSGTERTLECDLVAMNFGFVANSELARMAGAEVTFDAHRGGWIPRADAFGRTSVTGVLVAGDGAGLRGAWVAAAEGRIAGAAAVVESRAEPLDSIAVDLAAAFAERSRHVRFQAAVGETLRLPDGVWTWADAGTVCCRCECVTRARLDRAVSEGHTTVNAVKRNTRAGMGWCGGRVCMHTIAALVAGGRLAGDTEGPTPRPVARLVTLAEIANRAQP